MQTLKLLVLFGVIATVLSSAKKPAATFEKTKWLTLDEAIQNLKKEKRPVLIDLYTDWCGWCKVMDKKTYSNKNVSEYLSKKFYAVKLDAETRNIIQWNGKNYSFNPQYKTHDFAIFLTGGQLSYPTTVIIPADGQPQAIPGFLEPKDFELVVRYFAEGGYGKVSFDQFQKSFKPSW